MFFFCVLGIIFWWVLPSVTLFFSQICVILVGVCAFWQVGVWVTAANMLLSWWSGELIRKYVCTNDTWNIANSEFETLCRKIVVVFVIYAALWGHSNLWSRLNIVCSSFYVKHRSRSLWAAWKSYLKGGIFSLTFLPLSYVISVRMSLIEWSYSNLKCIVHRCLI